MEIIRKTISAFDRGDIHVIACDGLLLDRFEDPTVTCIVFATPFYSLLTYQRYLGLGLRVDPKNPEKVCTIIDIKDVNTKAVSCSRVFDLPSRIYQARSDIHRLSKETKELFRYHPLLLNLPQERITRNSIFKQLAEGQLPDLLNRIAPLTIEDKYLWIEWDHYHWFALLNPNTMVNLRINELGHHIVSIDKTTLLTYTEGQSTESILPKVSKLLRELDHSNTFPLFSPPTLHSTDPASESQVQTLLKKWRLPESMLVNITKDKASRYLYVLQLLSLFCQKHYRIGYGKYFGFPVPYLLFSNPDYIIKYAVSNPLLVYAQKNPSSWVYWLEQHKSHIWESQIISKINRATLLQFGEENLDTIRPIIHNALQNDLEYQALTQRRV